MIIIWMIAHYIPACDVSTFDIRQAHGEVNDDAKEKTERTR